MSIIAIDTENLFSGLKKGVPFRETHHISGAAIKMAEDRKLPLSSLTPKDLRTLHPLFEDDVAEIWDYNAR